MLILHITDLHVTRPGETLDTLWTGPEQVLEPFEFDAVVVSGDLTQRASSEEYGALTDFSRRKLLPLLAPSKRTTDRVVFVPGNHDVDWSIGFPDLAQTTDAVTLNSKQLLDEYRRDPSSSNLRLELAAEGSVLFRIDPDSPRYRKRLENCQRFFREFYGNSSGLKQFDLLEAGGDWSAHIFPDEQIVICGFNSCHGNDRLWVGASIDHRSIANAADYRKRKCANLFPVAVWHHGLTAIPGRPDFLPYQDLGRLQEAGFRVGFHGHVHAAAAWIPSLLRDEMILVSTGSLGAGTQDLPEAVGQQFSIVQVYPGRTTVDVYERNQPYGGQYQKNLTACRRVRFGTPARGISVPVHARRHSRTWLVGMDGVATVSVELEGLTAAGEILLEVTAPPVADIEYEAQAWVDGQPTTIMVSTGVQGRKRLALLSTTPSVSEIKWCYRVANAVPLGEVDLAQRDPLQTWFPNLKPACGIVHHVVQHDCDKLVLVLEFESKSGTKFQTGIASPTPIVEETSGDGQWRVVKEEVQRCSVNVSADCDNRRATLCIVAPVVGLRYGLQFMPKRLEKAVTSQILGLNDTVLAGCRKAYAGGDLSGALTRAMARQLAKSYKISARNFDNLTTFFSHQLDWAVYLWSSQDRRLLPAFGEFTTETWGERFASGSGLIGHAFRTGEATYWYTPEVVRSSSQVLYVEDIEPHQRPSSHREISKVHRWIIGVPLISVSGECVFGVVGFAGKKNVEHMARNALWSALDSLANSAARGDDVSTDKSTFERGVNEAFRKGLSTVRELRGKLVPEVAETPNN